VTVTIAATVLSVASATIVATVITVVVSVVVAVAVTTTPERMMKAVASFVKSVVSELRLTRYPLKLFLL